VSTLAVIAGVISGVAAAAAVPSTYSSRTRTVAMQEDPLLVDALNSPNSPTDPRVGNPFEKGGIRTAVPAYQPRGISDATVQKKQYIETEDEPWHSTAKETLVVGMDDLDKAFGGSLPFVAAEETLTVALSKATKKEDVKKAITAAKESGAREGSPALTTADKLLKAFSEKTEEEALKARPKAPKKAGAQGGGWDGMKRPVGAVHSTAGFV
jgi:hypothetical protein